MKSADKFLIAIVTGVIMLLGGAFILSQLAPNYQADDTADGVIYNYLLGLLQKDYERAYHYLSPELKGYPPSMNEFISDMAGSAHFDISLDGGTFTITDSDVFETHAVVTVETTYFHNSGLLGDYIIPAKGDFVLMKYGMTWQIVEGEIDKFWLECWETEVCRY